MRSVLVRARLQPETSRIVHDDANNSQSPKLPRNHYPRYMRSSVFPGMTQNLENWFFPDDRFPARLFTVRDIDMEGPNASVEIEIGGIDLRPFRWGGWAWRHVSPSVTTPKLEKENSRKTGCVICMNLQRGKLNFPPLEDNCHMGFYTNH